MDRALDATDARDAPARLRADPLFWTVAAVTAALQMYLARHQAVSHAPAAFYADEGYRLYAPLRLVHGESLFSGTFMAYPPVWYLVQWCAYELLGASAATVRTLLAAAQVGTTLLAYALARRFAPRADALVAAALTVAFGVGRLNVGYTGWYVVPLTLGTALLLCRALGSPRSSRGLLLAAGALAGLAVGIKLRDGAWLVVGSVAAVWAAAAASPAPPGDAGRGTRLLVHAGHLVLPIAVVLMIAPHWSIARAALFLAPPVAVSGWLVMRARASSEAPLGPSVGDTAALVAGCAATVGPWLVYYAWHAGPAPLWHDLVEIPLAMRDRMVFFVPPRATALAATCAFGVMLLVAARRSAALLAAVVAAGCVLAVALPVVRPGWTAGGVFLVLPLATAVALLLAGARTTPKRERRALVALACLNNATILTLYPFTGAAHWLWAAPLAFVILSIGLARARAAAGERHPALAGGVALGSLALVAGAAADGFARSSPLLILPESTLAGRRIAGAPGLDVPVAPDVAVETQQVVDFLDAHVPPGGYVLELPSGLYTFATGRRQAARLDYFFLGLDGTVWDEAREIAHIRRTSPTYALVRDRAYWAPRFPAVWAFVRENYEPVDRLGAVEVWRRRGSPDEHAPRAAPPDA